MPLLSPCSLACLPRDRPTEETATEDKEETGDKEDITIGDKEETGDNKDTGNKEKKDYTPWGIYDCYIADKEGDRIIHIEINAQKKVSSFIKEIIYAGQEGKNRLNKPIHIVAFKYKGQTLLFVVQEGKVTIDLIVPTGEGEADYHSSTEETAGLRLGSPTSAFLVEEVHHKNNVYVLKDIILMNKILNKDVYLVLQDTVSNTGCLGTRCPANSSTTVVGATTAEERKCACNPGYIYSKELDSCILAGEGTFSPGGYKAVALPEYAGIGDEQVCVPCGYNRYKETVSADKCLPCPPNSYSSSYSPTSKKDCDLCLPGFYETESEEYLCGQCPPDYICVGSQPPVASLVVYAGIKKPCPEHSNTLEGRVQNDHPYKCL
ncbi:hypothetical protein, conserved [Eimeria maxima]|uniref:Tyrosine-protein kinase ephrin type A/B receptor-like domain-containing protein n=1 Tax=Eimeria maxima TaxID=5804 RepID=U6LYM4_EIMMA|nr:hypothetical protein, conserved [Eimeria maxima]CDJ55978.1 hypothetical protein, conserved [Eimeria maxima]